MPRVKFTAQRITQQQPVHVQHRVKIQKQPEFAIPRAAFQKLAKEIAQSIHPDLRFQSKAIEALQTSSEDMLIHLLRDCQSAAHHANRTTIQPADMKLVMRLRQAHS